MHMQQLLFATLVALSSSPSLPLNSSILRLPSNAFLSSPSPIGTTNVTFSDWPIPPYRHQIRGDLYIDFRLYGRNANLSWGDRVAEDIHAIETMIGTGRFTGDLDGQIFTSGLVKVLFVSKEIGFGIGITQQDAAQVLGSIWAFSVAFSPREIAFSSIVTANNNLAIFFLTFPGI